MKQDVYAKSLQSCPTLGNALDCSPLGSSVYGILQARILELAAMLSWDLPNPEIKPMSLVLAGRFFTIEPPGKPQGERGSGGFR